MVSRSLRLDGKETRACASCRAQAPKTHLLPCAWRPRRPSRWSCRAPLRLASPSHRSRPRKRRSTRAHPWQALLAARATLTRASPAMHSRLQTWVGRYRWRCRGGCRGRWARHWMGAQRVQRRHKCRGAVQKLRLCWRRSRRQQRHGMEGVLCLAGWPWAAETPQRITKVRRRERAALRQTGASSTTGLGG